MLLKIKNEVMKIAGVTLKTQNNNIYVKKIIFEIRAYARLIVM